jgi:hypothetical protein
MIRAIIDIALGGILFSAIMIGTAALAIGLKLARSGG